MVPAAHRQLVVSAAFAVLSWALAAGAPVLAATMAEQAGPQLPPAEYKPLPVGTKVTYDTWGYTVTKTEGFDITFKTTAGNKFPCDARHCPPGCVGLPFHSTSTRIGDGSHVAAGSPNHDRRRDGVGRERVGVRGGRIGARVNSPVRLTGGRPLGAVAARNPPRRPAGGGGVARCIGSCPVTDLAPPPGVARKAVFWYGFTNQRGHPGNDVEFPRTG